MIDFKEKLHNDVNEILNESVILDEGLGDSLKSLRKGIGDGIKTAKTKYRNYKLNSYIKKVERYANEARKSTAMLIAEELKDIQSDYKALMKGESLAETQDCLTKIRDSANKIVQRAANSLKLFKALSNDVEKIK